MSIFEYRRQPDSFFLRNIPEDLNYTVQQRRDNLKSHSVLEILFSLGQNVMRPKKQCL